jgi:hypothetical protein
MKKLCKTLYGILVPVLLVGICHADIGTVPSPTYWNNVSTDNAIGANQEQLMQGQGWSLAESGDSYAEGGDASSIAVSGDSSADSHSTAVSGDSQSSAVSGDSSAGSVASISTTTIAKSKTRIPPFATLPPYLPYWQHGGWGTVKAYFPNGPNSDDAVYERVLDPDEPTDMRELRGVIQSLPHDGPLEMLGGFLNGVVAVFGGPDNFHHGRGFEIYNSVIRERRPKGKPLLVFIDSEMDRRTMEQAGYVYVGKIGVTSEMERNWDHAYDAALAEALPWDVDILLVSGGMKGVSIGSTTAFPGATGGYSQPNYSLSLFGSASSGVTEGKGKAVMSAEAYRYWPEAASRRRIPRDLYNRFHVNAEAEEQDAQTTVPVSATTEPEKVPGIEVSGRLYEMAGLRQNRPIQNVRIK